jgi:phosphatidylinositol alpha-mannosyltransferase
VARKGLPVLLSAFQALRERTPATLTLIGASAADVTPMFAELAGVRALGAVSDEVKRVDLRAADVLCAPSLYGESFGMVLTEAFAEGTPVVASDIPGYRDVARDGVEALLVQPGDSGLLADALLRFAADPERRRSMSLAARRQAEDFAWSRIARHVLAAYAEALTRPERERLTRRITPRGRSSLGPWGIAGRGRVLSPSASACASRRG